MRLGQLLVADLLKQKRSMIWLVLFIIPLGTTAAMFLDMYIRYSDYLIFRAQERGISSWYMLLIENHLVLGWGSFLPVFVAVISAIVHHTEFAQNSWKHLLSLPVSKMSVYLSKFMTIVLFSYLLILLNTLGLVLVGKWIGFPEALDLKLYTHYVMEQSVGILGVAAIHHWLSSRIANPISPIFLGLVGMIVSTAYEVPILSDLSPYQYPYLAAGLSGEVTMLPYYGGVIAGAIFIGIGIFDFRRRDIL